MEKYIRKLNFDFVKNLRVMQLVAVLAALLAVLSACSSNGDKYGSFLPGELWLDNNGVHINAHGGGILFHKGKYYWFGDHKIAGPEGNVAHVGVHCYSSKDLYNWTDEGIALSVVADDPNHEIARGRIIERPLVVYNEKNRKFVMWFHLEPYDRQTPEGRLNVEYGAKSGVAVSDNITGPYEYLYSLHPNGGHWPVNVQELHLTRDFPKERMKYSQDSPQAHTDSINILGRDMVRGQQARDMTLFVDDDGKAYHIYASEENSTLHIAALNDDYTRHTGKYIRLFVNRYMEAAAMFKKDGKYYLMMSGCSGWAPNEARSAFADSIFGEWRELGNPCQGEGAEITFNSQSSFILPVYGKKNRFIYMGDRWKADNAIDGRYVWLPIAFEGERFVIRWRDEWRLDDWLRDDCTQPTNHSYTGKHDYLYENLPFAMQRVEEPVFPNNRESIIRHGAVPDGVTLNTGAFAKAIDALTKKGGGTVVVPKGLWLTGPIVLQSNINLHIEEGAIVLFSPELHLYPVIETTYAGGASERCQSPVSGIGLTNIAITGKGVIDGWGEAWRPAYKKIMTDDQWKTLLKMEGSSVNSHGDWWSPPDNREQLRPVMISLQACNKVLLEGVTFKNSPAWNIHPLMCENLTVRDIVVLNPWFAANGDGIDVESCRNVVIVDSRFDVGDDAICIKSGRDEEGRKRGKPTENVIVDNCIVYHGHGGFVVGSEMSGGVRNIKVSNCTFMGTDAGLRFKSNRRRGGVVENIHICDINMVKIQYDPLTFDLFYSAANPDSTSIHDVVPVSEKTPQFKDIHISNVTCNGAERAMFFNGLPEMNISNIHISDVQIASNRGAFMAESNGVKLHNVRINVAKGPNLLLRDTKHIEIDGFSGNGVDRATVHVTGKKTKNITIAKSEVGNDDVTVDGSVDMTQVKIR